MCGLNGIYAYHTAAPAPDREELIATREHMAARGPDGAGEWWSPKGRCALGFRRLAIQDLSDHASQPMISEDGLHVIVFNGEIYNAPELRAQLQRQGRRFRTTSDTEVLLHLYALEGAAMVHRLRGMYAFGVWDEAQGGLLLARDPYGIKPLYTANDGWTLRFASQVKALVAGGEISRAPEPAGVVGFHLFGSVPEPFTIYRDIRALPAGHTQWIDEAGARTPQRFVSIAEVFAAGRDEAGVDPARHLRDALRDSVRAHLLADVEVGVFLSAGVDSGAILGLMREFGRRDVTALTISYEEFGGTTEDEAPLAARVAAMYDARHVQRRVTPDEFRTDLPRILQAMDQPSIDGVNTWFVAKAAHEAGLKVALSGLGGDELLGGYPSFRDLPRWTAMVRPLAVPGLGRALRHLAGAVAPGLRVRSPKALGLVEYGGDYGGAYFLRRGLFLPFELREQLDRDFIDAGMRRLAPLKRFSRELSPDPGSAFGRVATLESTHYLKNQLLRDADWAGMAHSVEIRTPLVDLRLLHAMVPLARRFRGDAGKALLAAAPSTPLPREVTDRPKTGFGVPMDAWLYGAGKRRRAKGAISREWALDLWRGEALGLTERAA